MRDDGDHHPPAAQVTDAMNAPIHPRLTRAVAIMPSLAGALVAACGVLVLIGWTWDVDFLKTLLHPERIAMNPATALCFVLCGVALFLLRREEASHRSTQIAHACGGIVALVGLLRFASFVGDWPDGPDTLLFADRLDGNVMSANSAMAFMLIGVALLILDVRTEDNIHPAQGFILATGCIALLALTGYLYRILPLYGVSGSKPMALNTAICFVFLATGTLCARPTRQPLVTLLDETVGGAVARRLLPAAFVVPLLLGWLRLVGEKKGVISSEFGFSMLILSIIIVFNALVWWNAQIQRRSDLRRKAIEGELRASEIRHRAVVEQASEGITLVDGETLKIIEANRALAKMLGYTHDELVGKPIQDLIVDTQEGIATRAQQTLQTAAGVASVSERQYRRKDGSVVDVEKSTTVLELEGRRVLSTVLHDITERKRAEEELRQSEARNRAVKEQAAEGIYLVDLESKRIIDANAALERLLGFERGEALTKTVYDLIDDLPANVDDRIRRLYQSPIPLHGERQYLRKDGSPVDVEASAAVITYGDRMVACTVVHDITQRKRAEQAVRESEERIRLIVETAQDAFIGMDADGLITGWNAQAEKTFGWSRAEAIGRVLAQTIVPPQYRQAHENGLRRFLETGEGPVLNQRIEIVGLHRDGHEFPVELTISPLRVRDVYSFNAFVHDISPRKAAERELADKHRQLEAAHEELKQAQSAMVQSEKLAGLGQMVAGVAHEINNPLAFVSNNVAVLQRDVRALSQLLKLYAQAEGLLEQHNAQLLADIRDLAQRMDLTYMMSNLDEMLARSREGLRRIQQIVKDLREFARLDAADLQEADINHGIESTLNIVRGVAKKKQVALEMELSPIPLVACYPAKVNQVVMNLVTNAIDACPTEGGKVIVRTARCDGDAIRIEVIDNGSGIPPEVRQRIFDPFFTTKAIGQGTGLGLSISYGIVQDHGGRIDLESEVGKGTRFAVTLPLHPTAAVTSTKDRPSRAVPAPP
jgi:PAS domain S-box-containing protein